STVRVMAGDAPSRARTVRVPRNIYGATKVAAEDLCELDQHDHGMPVVVLRTSRFFPEADDRPEVRRLYADANAKANEYLYRRVDISEAVEAHLLALDRAREIGFGRYVVSATTPFYPDEYAKRGWTMFPGIEPPRRAIWQIEPAPRAVRMLAAC